ncbi:hypothetical protein, partial [Pseudomonas gingeri]|uniref:hypothetical protein n=1 Tax=Pseudomonas gingeri TaxID=117681 RepID=UPI003B96CA35
ISRAISPRRTAFSAGRSWITRRRIPRCFSPRSSNAPGRRRLMPVRCIRRACATRYGQGRCVASSNRWSTFPITPT